MTVYYSGTGNSRYCAAMIADLIGDEVTDSMRIIKENGQADFSKEERLVFVSPVYTAALPVYFEKFIENAKVKAGTKAWFVMTCAGYMGASPAFCENVCREKGLRYMGTLSVTMPQNYILHYKMPNRERAEKIIGAAQPVITAAADQIAEGKAFAEIKLSAAETAFTRLVRSAYFKYFMKAKAFYATDVCKSCGTCADLCSLNNIRLEKGRPVWKDNCTHCVSCINRCPQKAIEYGKKTAGKERYECPEYTGKDRRTE